MPSSSAIHRGAIDSALPQLAAFLQSMRHTTGTIRVPSDLDESVKQALKAGGYLPEEDIVAIVSSLDSGGSSLCSRLSTSTFVTIFAILRLSPPCWEQYRGLYLLSQALPEDEVQPHSIHPSPLRHEDVPMSRRKPQIGAQIMQHALRSFCNSAVPESTRRWMGVLVLQLLKDCKDNRRLVVNGSDNPKLLLESFKMTESNALLRMLAGCMILEMMYDGVEEENLWPPYVDTEQHDPFPTIQYRGSQWLEALVSLMNSYDNQMGNARSSYIAHSHSIDQKPINVDASQKTFVNVDRTLTLAIPQHDGGFALFIDIPLQKIAIINLREPENRAAPNTLTRNTGSTLAIHLRETAVPTLYLNASPQVSKLLTLGFEEAQSGKDVRKMILERQVTMQEQETYQTDMLASSGRHIDYPPRTMDQYAIRSSYGGILGAASDGLANHGLCTSQGLDSTRIEPEPSRVTEQERLGQLASQANEVLSDKIIGDNVETTRSEELPSIPGNPSESRADGTQVRSAISPMCAYGTATSPMSERPRLSKSAAQAGFTAERHSQRGFYDRGVINFTRKPGEAPVTPLRDTPETPSLRRSVRLRGQGTPLIMRDANGSIVPGMKVSNGVEGRDPRNGKVMATSQNKESVRVRSQDKAVSKGAKSVKPKISERLEDRRGKALKGPVDQKTNSQLTRDSKATAGEPLKAPALSKSYRSGVLGKPQTYSKRKVRKSVEPRHEAAVDHSDDVFDIPESPSKTTKTPLVLKKAPSLKSTDTRPKTQSSRNPATSIGIEKPSRVIHRLQSISIDKQQDRSAYKGKSKSREHREDKNNNVADNTQDVDACEVPASGNKYAQKATSSPKDKIRKAVPTSRSTAEKSGLKVGKQSAPLTKLSETSIKSIPTSLDQSEIRRIIPSKTRSRINDVNTAKHKELLVSAQEVAISSPRHKEKGKDQVSGRSIEVLGTDLHERGKEGALATPHIDRQPTSPPRPEADYTENRNAYPVPHSAATDFEQEQAIGNARSVFEDGSSFILPQPILAEQPPSNMATLSTPKVPQAILKGKKLGVESSNHANDLVPVIDFVGVAGDPTLSVTDEPMTHQHFQDAMTYFEEDDWHHSTGIDETRPRDDSKVASQTIMQGARKGTSANQAMSLNPGKAPDARRSANALEDIVAPQATMLPKQNRGKESLALKLRSALFGLIESKQQDEEAPGPRKQSASERCAAPYENAGSSLDNFTIARSAQQKLQSTKREPKLGLNTKHSSRLTKFRDSPIGTSLPTGLESSGLPNEKNNGRPSDTKEGVHDNNGDQSELKKLYNYGEIFRSEGEQELRQDIDIDTTISKRNGKKRVLEKQVESDPKRAKVSVRPSTPIAMTPKNRVRRLIPMSDSQPRGFDDLQQKPDHSNVTGSDVRRTISPEENEFGKEAYGKQVRPLLEPSGLHGKRKHGDWQSVDEQQVESSSLAPQLVPETPADKRRRTLDIVLPTSEDTTRSLSRLVSTPMPTAYQKAGSQGTRIDPNGSPIPSLDQARRANSGVDINRLIRDLPSDIMGNDTRRQKDLDPSEPDLPAARSSAIPHRLPPLRKVPRTASSGNGKLLPSSPNAPSRMLSDMAAHRLQPGGNFINVETSGVIKPIEPQDPFVDNSRTNADSFLKMLRGPAKSTGKVKTTNVGRTSDSRMPIDLSVNRTDDDPTMVGTEPREKAQRHEASVRYSPSSPSTNSSPQCASREDSEEGREQDLGKQWRDALKPYQKDTLDILYDITNRLVRHLLDKEDAVDEVVEEYERDGLKLIDALEQAHAHYRQEYQGKVDNARARIAKNFGEWEDILEGELKRVRQSRVGEIEEKWKTDVAKIQSHLDAALLAYGA